MRVDASSFAKVNIRNDFQQFRYDNSLTLRAIIAYQLLKIGMIKSRFRWNEFCCERIERRAATRDVAVNDAQ
jgi:hypothetical protein